MTYTYTLGVPLVIATSWHSTMGVWQHTMWCFFKNWEGQWPCIIHSNEQGGVLQNPSYSCGMCATLLQSQVGTKHVEESNALVKF